MTSEARPRPPCSTYCAVRTRHSKDTTIDIRSDTVTSYSFGSYVAPLLNIESRPRGSAPGASVVNRDSSRGSRRRRDGRSRRFTAPCNLNYRMHLRLLYIISSRFRAATRLRAADEGGAGAAHTATPYTSTTQTSTCAAPAPKSPARL